MIIYNLSPCRRSPLRGNGELRHHESPFSEFYEGLCDWSHLPGPALKPSFLYMVQTFSIPPYRGKKNMGALKRSLFIILCWMVLSPGYPLWGDSRFAKRVGALLDVNPTSPTFNFYILPQDYQGLVSGWYFGHST